jgi:VCBS repeat-containing protein
MTNKNRTPHIISIVSLAVFIALGLASASKPGGGGQRAESSGGEAARAAESYFTGDGGKGKSITILPLQSSGLAESDNYLPAMVQGELVSNFDTYSDMDVMDRVNLDEQYDELFSGYYADDAQESWDFGHLSPTTYLMGGNITRTSTGYALQMRITRYSDKMTMASYSGTCTFEELDNLTGVRRASLDLLQKMDIKLTERTRTELTRAPDTTAVQAQMALARGITAQRQGTEVAALNYFNQAAALNPSLREAGNRVSILAANISSGNIGENVRNDIVWRRNWLERLTETEQYFAELNTAELHFTLFYSDEIKQGAVNYQNETVTLSIETYLRPSHTWGRTIGVPMQRTLRAVYNGLQATQRTGDWGLQGWPGRGVTNLNSFARQNSGFAIDAELLNDRNQVIGRQSFRGEGWWEYAYSQNAPVSVRISDDVRRTVSFTVKADDITNRLTIRIAGVNGESAETAARNGILQIRAITKAEFDRNVTLNSRFNFVLGEIRGTSSNARREDLGRDGFELYIPGVIWGDPVSSIGREAFNKFRNIETEVVVKQGYSVSTYNQSYSIPATKQIVRHDVPPRSVYLPDSVTNVGENAFFILYSYKHPDDLSSSKYPYSPDKISIGANVTIRSNGLGAFAEAYNRNNWSAGLYELKFNIFRGDEWIYRGPR